MVESWTETPLHSFRHNRFIVIENKESSDRIVFWCRQLHFLGMGQIGKDITYRSLQPKDKTDTPPQVPSKFYEHEVRKNGTFPRPMYLYGFRWPFVRKFVDTVLCSSFLTNITSDMKLQKALVAYDFGGRKDI